MTRWPPVEPQAPLRASIEVLTPVAPAVGERKLSVSVTKPTAAPITVDASGEPVPKGPSPVPPVDDGAAVRIIAPGESLTLAFRGSSRFPSGIPSGSRRVRYHSDAPGKSGFFGELTSPWAEFRVSP